jgi:hypothetical protein
MKIGESPYGGGAIFVTMICFKRGRNRNQTSWKSGFPAPRIHHTYKIMKPSAPSKFIHCIAALSLAISTAHGATINFDDLPGSEGPIPLGHGGFTWTNFYFLNAQTYGTNPSGYLAGMVSASKVAFNAGGSPASFSAAEPFNLVSAYLTGAWNDGLQVTVTGFNGVNQVATQTVTTSAYAPTLYTFNFNNITSVTFSSAGGVQAYPAGTATHFAMDNLTVSAIPEPGSAALVLLGSGLLLRRRVARPQR